MAISGSGGIMIDELFVRLGARIDTSRIAQFEQRIARVRQNMNQMGDAAMRWGFASSAAIGVVLRTTYQYQEAVNAVKAAWGDQATIRDMDRIQAKTRELGKTTAFSATQAMRAAEEFAKAGFTPQQTEAALPTILNMAAAGDLTMQRSAEIASKTLKGFGLDPEKDLERVADVLAYASTRAATSIPELFEGTVKFAPLVQAMGGSFEEAVAMVAKIQDVGFDPSIAGTQLRQAKLGLLDLAMGGGTDDAKTALGALGMAPGDIKKFMDDGRFLDALRQLMTGGMSLEEASMIFDKRTLAPIQALIEQMYGPDGVVQLVNDLEERSRFSSSEMAATRMEGIVGDWKTFVSKWQELQLTLGEAGLATRSGALMRYVGDWFDYIAGGTTDDMGRQRTPGLSKKWQEMGVDALTLGAGLVVVGAAFKVIAWALGPFWLILKPLAAGLAWIARTITSGLYRAVPVLGKLILAIGTFAAAILGVPVWVIGAIAAALVALVGSIWYFWDEIVEIWQKIRDWLPDWVTKDREGGAGDMMGEAALDGIIPNPSPSSRVINDNSTTKIDVMPPPGTSAEDVAKEVVKEMQRVPRNIAENADDGGNL